MVDKKDKKKILVLTPPHPLLRPAGVVFTLILAIILAAIFNIGGWITRTDTQVPRESLPPVTESPVEVLPTESQTCADVDPNLAHICCTQWAADNEVMTPQCIGQWEVQAGMCAWVCDTSGMEELRFEQNQMIPSVSQ